MIGHSDLLSPSLAAQGARHGSMSRRIVVGVCQRLLPVIWHRSWITALPETEPWAFLSGWHFSSNPTYRDLTGNSPVRSPAEDAHEARVPGRHRLTSRQSPFENTPGVQRSTAVLSARTGYGLSGDEETAGYWPTMYLTKLGPYRFRSKVPSFRLCRVVSLKMSRPQISVNLGQLSRVAD